MEDFKEEGISYDIRERAHFKRYSYFENVDFYLLMLEKNLINSGFSVDWAATSDSLCKILNACLPQKTYNRVCVDSTSVPDSFLGQTDVVQNFSADDVLTGGSDVTSLIVDVDFAVAQSGELLFLDRPSSACFNNIHNLIVLVNIDKVLIDGDEISLFSYLKENKNEFASSLTILQSPFQFIQSDEFQASDTLGYTKENVSCHVIFYDNRVSSILENPLLRESLYCIQCGRCSQVCPTCQAGSTMSPVELVKANCFDHFSRTKQIYKLCSICGNCQSVCPINIPLTDLLVYEMGLINSKDRFTRNKLLFSAFSKRSKMNKYSSKFLNRYFIRKIFGKNRVLKDYFNSQSGDFFNIIKKESEYTDD